MFADGTSHVVSEDLVVKMRLLEGKALSTSKMKDFLAEKAIDKALQNAKSYGLKKRRSSEQMATYLTKYDSTKKQYDTIINRLESMDILDDEQFIESLIQREFYEKRYGKRKLHRLLREAGIDPDIIKERLANISHDDIDENLRILFDKKRSRMRNRTVRAAMQTIIGYMANRGYDYTQAKRYVSSRKDDLKMDIDEENVLEKDYRKLLKKWSGRLKDEREMNDKIIKSLLRKGHDYEAIKKIIGRG